MSASSAVRKHCLTVWWTPPRLSFVTDSVCDVHGQNLKARSKKVSRMVASGQHLFSLHKFLPALSACYLQHTKRQCAAQCKSWYSEKYHEI